MRKNVTRAISLMLAVFVAFGMLIVSAPEAEAASGPFKLVKETLWAKCEYYSSAPVEPVDGNDWELIEKATLVSVKSSKPSVIKAVKSSTEKDLLSGYYLVPKKTGKSKITVKYKVKGKTYSMSQTITVKKYPNPVKSIKVNGKTKKITNGNKYYFMNNNYKKTSATIKYKLNDGWKVVNVYYFLSAGDQFVDKQLSKSAMTKGKTIKFAKKYEHLAVFVDLQNSKGETFQHSIQFDRGDN